MCLICVSYTRELNVSRFSKEVKISGKHRRIAAQIPSYDDIQSNTTYMERLSDMVRSANLRLKLPDIMLVFTEAI